jgi:hypothetical protein
MQDESGAKVLLLLGMSHVAGNIFFLMIGTWKLPSEIIPEVMACLGCLQAPIPGKRSKSNVNEQPTERTKKVEQLNSLSAKVFELIN